MDNTVALQRFGGSSAGPVLSSGVPVIIYGYNVIGEITGVGPSMQFFNGTTDETDIIIQENTPADETTTVVYPQGILFPLGCFFNPEAAADQTQITVFYKKL